MPTRYLKESINTSHNMAELSHGAERMCTRLITRADDYGRFDAHPEVIKGGCFPLVKNATIEDIVGWKKELAQWKLVRYYRINGREYGYFITWEKHQGKPRAKQSKFPDPPIPVGIRRQVRALVRKPGHPQADSPGIRSSVSESSNRLRSSIPEVRSGPQPIRAVIQQLAQRLEPQHD